MKNQKYTRISRKNRTFFEGSGHSHVTPKGSSGNVGSKTLRKPAESAGKLCQNLSLAVDQEKSQYFEANQSIEISWKFSNPGSPKITTILEKPACYGHIRVPKKRSLANSIICFLQHYFEGFISYVSAMQFNARVCLEKSRFWNHGNVRIHLNFTMFHTVT